jgi:hypothetical protein
MSQFNAPPMRRASGGLDVYTGLLFVAVLVLLSGVALLAMRNMEHSKVGNDPGGIIKLVP